MKRFMFKLEPLFEYRKRLEEICRKDLAEALRKLAEEEKKLEGMNAMCAKAVEEVDAMKERGAQPGEYDGYYSYISGLRERIKGQERVLKAVSEAFEAGRARVIEASKARKVIETMRDRARDAHETAALKAEQKISDDLTSARFVHSRKA